MTETVQVQQRNQRAVLWGRLVFWGFAHLKENLKILILLYTINTYLELTKGFNIITGFFKKSKDLEISLESISKSLRLNYMNCL